MEEVYISFKTAELAKKKQFNYACKLCYAGEGSTPLPFDAGNAIM